MGLPSRKRLHSRREFERVFKEGHRYYSHYFRLYWLDAGERWTRYGIMTSRKLGGAVARNRIKRCIREVLRAADARLPAGYYILVAPQRLTGKVKFRMVEEFLLRGLRECGLLKEDRV